MNTIERLKAIRQKIVDSGQKLLTLDEINAVKGGYEDVLAERDELKALLDEAVEMLQGEGNDCDIWPESFCDPKKPYRYAECCPKCIRAELKRRVGAK